MSSVLCKILFLACFKMWYISKLLMIVIITHDNCKFYSSPAVSHSFLFESLSFFTATPLSKHLLYPYLQTSMHVSIQFSKSHQLFNPVYLEGLQDHDMRCMWNTMNNRKVDEKRSPHKMLWDKDPYWQRLV